jgi:hypothetical protein
MNIDEIYLGDAYKLIKKVPDKSIDRLNGVTVKERESNAIQIKLF